MSNILEAYDFISRTEDCIRALVCIIECKSEVSDLEVSASLDNIVIQQLEQIASDCCDLCKNYRNNYD
ncbi:hypothetical protein [Ruminococcus flavefaciens]|uniref:hypothetical protein n=1 Tax=Ruminococcus flavefaciens TaxID=1265 RepID=UPI0011B2472A|nr:hypothetical protein [Ruminococcus flavefaciens]